MKRILVSVLVGCGSLAVAFGAPIQRSHGGYQVYPGDRIQDALQLAAANPTNKLVTVHAGEYRPMHRGQALIWFNRLHDGIRLEAEGVVTLTAANPELAFPSEPGFPAVVNHVVYFGDGISSNTVLKGFRVTGANHFITKEGTKEMEPNHTIPRNYFFYSDGGAIKIFGHSYPTLQNLEIVDNFANPCGAGISIQQQGFSQNAPLIENCVFLRNRAEGTGSAIDLLAGSAARINNCLFVGNVSNLGPDPVAKNSGERPFVNNGVLTIFWKSRATVRNCTFTGNRNGIDDMGGESSFTRCILVGNALDAGLKGFERYELAVNAGAKVSGCVINGTIHDVRHDVSSQENALMPPPPQFNLEYVPEAPEYRDAGYRPSSASNQPALLPR